MLSSPGHPMTSPWEHCPGPSEVPIPEGTENPCGCGTGDMVSGALAVLEEWLVSDVFSNPKNSVVWTEFSLPHPGPVSSAPQRGFHLSVPCTCTWAEKLCLYLPAELPLPASELGNSRGTQLQMPRTAGCSLAWPVCAQVTLVPALAKKPSVTGDTNFPGVLV